MIPVDLNAKLPNKPENVNFFKVITHKMENGKNESIKFDDVLFCEKTKFIDPDYYILIKENRNKLGLIRTINENGNFILESNPKDKNLFPNYHLNINDFDEVYRLISLSRDDIFQINNYVENWDDYNEVLEWKPETIEDEITYQFNIRGYLEKN